MPWYILTGRGCSCPDLNCIMSASLSNPPPTRFSSCSLEDLNELINDGDDFCLFNIPGPSVGGPRCGNRILEGNETCDCGGEAACTDLCCNATTCEMILDQLACIEGKLITRNLLAHFCNEHSNY